MSIARPAHRYLVLRWLPWSAALLMAAGACEDSGMELPSPPDMTSVVDAYQNPTGTVDPTNVACIGQAALDRVQNERLPPLRDLLVDAIEAVRQRLENSGLPTDTIGTSDEDAPVKRGTVRMERICRGWNPQATTPDPQTNGKIVLTAVVDGKLLGVLWGEATACQGRVGSGSFSQNLYLNASLRIYLYRGLQVGGQSTFLVTLQGAYGTDTERSTVDRDFRVSSSGIDLRLSTQSGDIVASVANGVVTLQTRDGTTYVYDPATATCNN